MTTAGRLIAIVTALCASAATSTAHAAVLPARDSLTRSLEAQVTIVRYLDQKPKPKPKGKMKLIKSGAEVALTEKQQGRQETRRSLLPAKKADPVASSLIKTPSRGKQIAPFRLNIGICGQIGPDGTIPGPTRCQPFVPGRPTPPPAVAVVAPQVPKPGDVAWEQILTQYKDVLFPKLGVKVQPAGRTLVNLDTIVYTDESKISTNTVTLLGFPVVVEATPMSYSWDFGDGSPVLVTSTPGKPYPSKDVTHKYMKRGSTKVSLTTNYAARFNVAGTGWQYVDGTVPIAGPATDLLIREAVPVLVEPNR
jgi:hypothetical protein